MKFLWLACLIVIIELTKVKWIFQKKMNKYSSGLIIVDMKNICFRSFTSQNFDWAMGNGITSG